MPQPEDAHAHTQQPPKRSSLPRTSSSSSYIARSPSGDGQTPHRSKAVRHIVGGTHSRMGPRNTSFGKNLNKLGKLQPAHPGDGNEKAKGHRRSHSGNLATSTSPKSPRPAFVKRNASAMVVPKVTSTTALRKNHSSGQLARNPSHKNIVKTSKQEPPAMKRQRSNPKKSEGSPPHKPQQSHVRFDVGEDEGREEEDWTEASHSQSQSPATTRTNTRQNSVAENLDKHGQGTHFDGTSESRQRPPPGSTPSTSNHNHKEEEQHNRESAYRINGSSSYQSSRPPDADIITSRLLQRNPHTSQPKVSAVSATATPDARNPRSLANSQGSTLGDTPGRDVVSRFINGDSASGTPQDGSFLPQGDESKQRDGDGDPMKRNQSLPNFANKAASNFFHSRTMSQRSSGGNPSSSVFAGGPANTSRTQQKMDLQRASSNIEPQKLIPAILPRTGGPQILNAEINYASSSIEGGRIDPRLQRQFDQAALEYKVVRRFRNPVADSISRIHAVPGTPTHKQAPTPRSARSSQINGSGSDRYGLSSSFQNRQHLSHAAEERASEHSSRRARVSFEVPGPEGDGEGAGGHSFGSDGPADAAREPRGDEAQEICRRLWEMAEVAEGG
ncbi:hypothetical protein K402DRAFT_408010 [Aulographum hederae CBS 113979]|uniref:Uncharacterized protein n=1 Tax=Aulographum hederae CBS 113979 TaxID=1176131 RepID=A0A6G1GMK2_9PEZI|nr:hypothetical protein K402DRAFT_408010 [Aulographum hederae CBS 113979]